MTIGVVGIALLLCALTAGFLFAFAVVVMPGIATLDDEAYLRAFQVMDGIIQGNHPLFILMWVGSLLAMLAVLVLGFRLPSGPEQLLLVGAAVIYLGGVQLPTAVVNIPLNNRVQSLQLDQIDASATQSARRAFEPRWNRWNVIRTVVAITSVLMLVVAVLPSVRTGGEAARAGAEEFGRRPGPANIVREHR